MDRRAEHLAAIKAEIAELNEISAALRDAGYLPGSWAGKAVAFEAYDVFEPLEGKALVEKYGAGTEGGKQKERLIVHGKVADFDWDRQDEIFEPGAFDRGLEEFKKNPIMVFSHAKQVMDTTNGPSGYVQIGRWDPASFEKRPDGLYARGEVFKPQAGFMRDVYDQIERGEMRGASVGGKFTRHRDGAGKVRISKVDLHEISIAPKPVNPRTLLSVVSAP